MKITDFFSLLGGLALFLYGMQMMSNGLEAAAGNRMKQILEKLTANRILGVLVGAGITAVIQSSSATTVMVVGFVNSFLIPVTAIAERPICVSLFVSIGWINSICITPSNSSFFSGRIFTANLARYVPNGINNKVVAILNNVCIFAICADTLPGVKLSIRDVSGVSRHTIVKIVVPIMLNNR